MTLRKTTRCPICASNNIAWDLRSPDREWSEAKGCFYGCIPAIGLIVIFAESRRDRRCRACGFRFRV